MKAIRDFHRRLPAEQSMSNLAVLDDAAFGAATEVMPKFRVALRPGGALDRAHGRQAFFAYSAG